MASDCGGAAGVPLAVGSCAAMAAGPARSTTLLSARFLRCGTDRLRQGQTRMSVAICSTPLTVYPGTGVRMCWMVFGAVLAGTVLIINGNGGAGLQSSSQLLA